MSRQQLNEDPAPKVAMNILQSLNVIDFSTGIAGAYASKLLADAGADVIKVEPVGGDPLRRRAVYGEALDGNDSALFRFLNASKRSIVGGSEDESIRALVREADLVIESDVPAGIDIASWRQSFPDLTVLSVTPYGRVGPWADRPATEFTVQAEGGSIAWRGRVDEVPFQVGGRLIEWCAGLFGAVGALAAVIRARVTGLGEHVDASWLAAATFASTLGLAVEHSFSGKPELSDAARVLECPSIEPTKDGFVGFMTGTRQQFDDFLLMIERDDLLGNESWAVGPMRYRRVDEWNELTRPWFASHTTDEIVELASALRIPVARVNSGQTVLAEEQFTVRNAFGPSPDGEFVQPMPSYKIDCIRPCPRGRAPRLGQHQGAAFEKPHRRSASSTGASPFEGLKVIDATAVWAGPSVGHLFGALGADVIHVESIQRPDMIRGAAMSHRDDPNWWEWSPSFFQINTNKRDLTLDLGSAQGRDLFEKLIRTCDVLVENFSPRVFDSFGFTRERVKELNPNAVFVRMPAFGLDGPWRDNVGMAQTMEQMSGLAWVTGHADGDAPRIPRGPCDPIAGYHAAFATLVALWARIHSGSGAFVEAAMVEAALNVTAELTVEYGAYGKLIERDGNRSHDAAPQGLYACQGFEQWLALSVCTDAQWEALRQLLGSPQWTDDPALATLEGRRAAHDRIDVELQSWARDRDLNAAVDVLVAAGIPAGRATDPRLTGTHPQLAALGFFEEVDHPVVGSHPVSTLPFRYSSVDKWIHQPAPTLGQHSREILRDLLGVDDPQIDDLERRRVTGTTL